MAPIRNGRHLYLELPIGLPVPGKTTAYDNSRTIDLENVTLDGGILIKTLVFSIDPFIRGRMRAPNVNTHIPALQFGEPLSSYGVGKVLRSENSIFKPGDHVYGMIPCEEYIIARDTVRLTMIENKESLPWSVYVGVCGMPGQTAYYGWKEFSAAKEGEVAYVTAAAGPVGSTVVQLAKSDSCKVIASAGSDEKVAFVRSIGADVAFNYKTGDTNKTLEEEGPVNIYWDSVGGETLETALANSAVFGRFIECGMISQVSSVNTLYPIKNLWQVIAKQLKITGFICSSLHTKYSAEFYREIPRRVAEGEIKYLEDREYGLDKVGQALVDVLTGKNNGKKVIIVADD
ncbi:hypothetical protein CERSUDRAFT_93269 [Gelatoporia subvermispora B]|uniref:Enoyl reductase (ER) domain-containing protein n=1 Tax=Ceriporiopsis subvermispora (strain B) TaxID=914234 RepID=M2RK66_CERS8|nr:hypothetical protein CERSUDRAFT_93269 [Gelatoporia subvermispora B]